MALQSELPKLGGLTFYLICLKVVKYTFTNFLLPSSNESKLPKLQFCHPDSVIYLICIPEKDSIICLDESFPWAF